MNKKLLAVILLFAVFAAGLVVGFRLGVASVPQSEVVVQPTETPGGVLTETEPETVQPDPGLSLTEPKPEPEPEPDPSGSQAENLLDEDGWYDTRDEVALYLITYGHLPGNFVTKNEARKKGWSSGSLEPYFPGCSIGGDVFQNREGLLPKAKGRTYYECDIGTTGKNSRGSKRIVFSNDGLIYYTDDHYESFTLLYGEEN